MLGRASRQFAVTQDSIGVDEVRGRRERNRRITSIIVLSLFSNIGKTGFAKAVPICVFHCIEHRRSTRAMASPTQKMWMPTPMAIICKENGYFIAPDSGTTMRFMKK